jgi:hypothetical protein
MTAYLIQLNTEMAQERAPDYVVFRSNREVFCDPRPIQRGSVTRGVSPTPMQVIMGNSASSYSCHRSCVSKCNALPLAWRSECMESCYASCASVG